MKRPFLGPPLWEDKKLLRKTLAYCCWGAGFSGLTVFIYFMARHSQLPGFFVKTLILALGWSLFLGAVGYIFYSGMIIGDD